MIGLCYVLASVALLAIALCGGLVTMLWSTNARALASAKLADDRGTELDDLKLKLANASTETAVAAEKSQERRADILEGDLDKSAAPTNPFKRLAEEEKR